MTEDVIVSLNFHESYLEMEKSSLKRVNFLSL